MKLPGGDQAIVDRRRLLAYNLLESHSVGGAKSRVFRAALGLTVADVDLLIDSLKSAAASEDAALRNADEYGRALSHRFRAKSQGPKPHGAVRLADPVRWCAAGVHERLGQEARC